MVQAAQQAGQEGHQEAWRAGGARGVHGEGGAGGRAVGELLGAGRPAEGARLAPQPAQGVRHAGRQSGQPRAQEEVPEEAGSLGR